MKKTTMLLICLAFVSSHVSAQKLHNANDLYSLFADILDSINAKSVAWASELNSAEKSGSYINVKVRRLEMEEILDNDTKAVEEAKEISSSGEFKKAMLEFIAFEKNHVNMYFIPFESLKPTSSPMEKEKYEHSLEIDAQHENDELEKVKKAQKAYAVKNGLEGYDDTQKN